MTDLTDEVGDSRERVQIVESLSRVIGKDMELDSDARDLARDALAKISSHERLCTERWQQQVISLNRLESTIDEIKATAQNQVAKIPAGIIAALVGVIGFLSARAFPIH